MARHGFDVQSSKLGEFEREVTDQSRARHCTMLRHVDSSWRWRRAEFLSDSLAVADVTLGECASQELLFYTCSTPLSIVSTVYLDLEMHSSSYLRVRRRSVLGITNDSYRSLTNGIAISTFPPLANSILHRSCSNFVEHIKYHISITYYNCIFY